MTQEEKNIKICEVLGWVVAPCGSLWTTDPAGLRGPFRKFDDLPNHFNDLNACHEMEEVLTDHQQMMMNHELKRRSRKTNIPAWRANASERAEAFGLTLNLWKHQ